MATYAELTTEQQTQVNDLVNLARAWSGEQARTNNHGEAIVTSWIATVQAILITLDAGTVIPNASGLAGTVSLTKEEVLALGANIVDILTDASAHTGGLNTPALRQAWSKACGANNLIG